jgi:hypothetical protein
MTPFEDRAEEMGLNDSMSYKGLYTYEDRYSKIAYRVLAAQSGVYEEPAENQHPTDGAESPIIGIWTAQPGRDEFIYAGKVSQLYKFVGNQVISDRIRESLSSVGSPMLRMVSYVSPDLTLFREEMILQSSQSSEQAGDIRPVMIASNSYNGTRAATVGFGIAVDGGEIIGNTIFGFSMGEMRMVHVESSTTRLTSGINRYMEVFNEHIINMIDRSFETQITEEQMFATLDIIEKYGKRRRNKISEILAELQPASQEGQEPPLPTVWNVFLAIARYCALEPNLNMKRMLENVAESVLVVPTRMYEVLEELQRS